MKYDIYISVYIYIEAALGAVAPQRYRMWGVETNSKKRVHIFMANVAHLKGKIAYGK